MTRSGKTDGKATDGWHSPSAGGPAPRALLAARRLARSEAADWWKKRAEEEREGYVLETWDLDLNGIENVPAYLARPRGLAGRAPAVLFDHSHGGGYTIGKKEFIEGRQYAFSRCLTRRS